MAQVPVFDELMPAFRNSTEDHRAMVGKDIYPVYMILGLVVAVYCSHAFGMRPLSQDSLVKPELVPWHHQTTPSDWYGFTLEFTDGLSISKWPSCWDFFIEMIVFLSGGAAGKIPIKVGVRNIYAMFQPSVFRRPGGLGVIVGWHFPICRPPKCVVDHARRIASGWFNMLIDADSTDTCPCRY